MNGSSGQLVVIFTHLSLISSFVEAKRKADSDSEDDEPLVKKKKTEPSNDEVRKVIKDILRDADLEQVTMKTVCKQVNKLLCLGNLF